MSRVSPPLAVNAALLHAAPETRAHDGRHERRRDDRPQRAGGRRRDGGGRAGRAREGRDDRGGDGARGAVAVARFGRSSPRVAVAAEKAQPRARALAGHARGGRPRALVSVFGFREERPRDRPLAVSSRGSNRARRARRAFGGASSPRYDSTRRVASRRARVFILRSRGDGDAIDRLLPRASRPRPFPLFSACGLLFRPTTSSTRTTTDARASPIDDSSHHRIIRSTTTTPTSADKRPNINDAAAR